MSEGDNHVGGSSPRLGSMKKLILFNNIRVRLLEQLCYLDIKTESNSHLINELSDFFQHRADVELEHSRNLDKLLHSFETNHNEQTQKCSKQWPYHTAYACWHRLVNETQSLSYDYATLSEVYNVNVIFKVQNILRIYKKYHDLTYEAHEEILRILRNFYTTIRTYHIYQNDKGAGSKLRSAESQRKRMQYAEQTEKVHLHEKNELPLSEKQSETFSKGKLEILRARNIYKHYTEASNARIHKYMLRDLKDIIYSMDTGFGLMMSRAILAHVTSDQKLYLSKLHILNDPLLMVGQVMDIRIGEKKNSQRNYLEILTDESTTFGNQLREEKNQLCTRDILHFEFELQLQLLRLKEDNLRTSLEKLCRLLDAIELNSIDRTKTNMKISVDNRTSTKSIPVKHTIQKSILGSKAKITPPYESVFVPTQFINSNRTAQKNLSHHPKLFGGSLEEYLKATNEQIPLVMRSCIRVINLFGLHSQGIFRVSGSQVEILNLRDSFQRGEDPLAGATDASDVNSVAGVLKLYLRELQEPLFPTKYFDTFISLIQMDSKYDVVTGMRNFLKHIPKSVVIVIRFLFSFLNHLSEYANENMMDAFNLAISFGPP